jgi:hypothetical protein
VAYLRREAAAVFDLAELMARSRSWLIEHQYLLLRERDIRRLAIAARRHQERALFKLIAAVVPAARDLWVPSLLAPIEDGGLSRREWLGAVPSSTAVRGLAEQVEKVEFLKELGADRLVLPDLALAGLEYFARRMMSRKPAALARIKDPHRRQRQWRPARSRSIAANYDCPAANRRRRIPASKRCGKRSRAPSRMSSFQKF